MIERKTISIYAFDLTPTIAITYNVNEFGYLTHLQFWIRTDVKSSFTILNYIWKMMSALEIKQLPFSELLETDVFQVYQRTFDIKSLYKNYEMKSDQFATQKMSNTKVPHRDFTHITKKDVDWLITTNIRKGE